MKNVPKVLVLASGDENDGGSGFEKLVIHQRGALGVSPYEVIGVVSNHERGGVRKRANWLGIPFYFGISRLENLEV